MDLLSLQTSEVNYLAVYTKKATLNLNNAAFILTIYLTTNTLHGACVTT